MYPLRLSRVTLLAEQKRVSQFETHVSALPRASSVEFVSSCCTLVVLLYYSISVSPTSVVSQIVPIINIISFVVKLIKFCPLEYYVKY